MELLLMKKKDEPVYQEMRSLAPYFLVISGIYMAILAVLFFAANFDYTLLTGGLYGIILSALSFLMLGKAAQSALRKKDAKAAQVHMNIMYCLRYLGLFAMLTIGALAPFISLVASVFPLFFPRIAITARTIIKKEE